MFNAVEQVSYDAKSPQNQRNVDRWSLLYIRALIGYAMAFIGNDLSKGSNNEIHNIAEQAISQTRQSSEAQVYNVSIKTIKANITEPEALASLVLHSQVIPFKHGDRFLVLDIGGATSDLCFFQVQNIYGHHICLALKRENPFRGISKGCMDIDRAFHLDIYGRLCTARIPNPSGLATQMSRSSEYRAYKARYRGPEDKNADLSLTIPGCRSEVSIPEAQIRYGKMTLGEFNTIVDVSGLRGHILQILELAPYPLARFVIAGGGSRMPYLRDTITQVAPILTVLDPAAVAMGCLLKWSQQLLLMTVIVRDTPPRKHSVGTNVQGQREDLISYVWRKSASGAYTTVSYMIE